VTQQLPFLLNVNVRLRGSNCSCKYFFLGGCCAFPVGEGNTPGCPSGDECAPWYSWIPRFILTLGLFLVGTYLMSTTKYETDKGTFYDGGRGVGGAALCLVGVVMMFVNWLCPAKPSKCCDHSEESQPLNAQNRV
jgi:hypothetical protein